MEPRSDGGPVARNKRQQNALHSQIASIKTKSKLDYCSAEAIKPLKLVYTFILMDLIALFENTILIKSQNK